jgi:hypothetical protein
MTPGGSFGQTPAAKPGRVVTARIDEGRLDPGLERLTTCAAPPAVPSYLFVGLPICFTIALGIILLGSNGPTPTSLGFIGLGVLGLFAVRYLNRHC